jgi:hypothetical protein
VRIKDWTASKTLIINSISLVIALATLFAGPGLGLDPQVAHIAGIVLAVANVTNLWLRSMTTTAVRLPGQSKHGRADPPRAV